MHLVCKIWFNDNFAIPVYSAPLIILLNDCIAFSEIFAIVKLNWNGHFTGRKNKTKLITNSCFRYTFYEISKNHVVKSGKLFPFFIEKCIA